MTRLPILSFCLLAMCVATQGHAGYTKNIMLTGYWPPTNEMIRPFSTHPDQNPDGWVGENWEGRGYDVYSFFPEFDNFPLDRVGTGDFTVDYQDTSEDFWRITSEINPVAMITFSQTSRRAWEIETQQRNLDNWVPDAVEPFQPTPSPPDDSVPAGHIRGTSLPAQEIVDAVADAGLPRIRPFIDDVGFGGAFLSEFMAYHGTWYHDLHSSPDDEYFNVAAGHIHVGSMVPIDSAVAATEITLRTLIDHVDNVLGIPEPDGFPMCAIGLVGVAMCRRRRG